MRRRAAARGDSGGRFFFVRTAPAPTACRRGARLRRWARVAPAHGLEPWVRLPDGCRWERGACRRRLAVRDRAEGARLV